MKHAPIAAVLVVSLALTNGCSTSRGAKIAAGVGAFVTGLGGLVLVEACSGYRGVCPTIDVETGSAPGAFGVGIIAIGGVGLIASLVNLIVLANRSETKHDRELETERASANERQRAREAAWTLTKAAVAAAYAGDCETVKKIDPEVRALDPAFHSSVFLGEQSVGIKRCLSPSTTLQTDERIAPTRPARSPAQTPISPAP